MEEDDCTNSLREQGLRWAGRRGQFGDNYLETAERLSGSPEESSQLHPWQDAAVSPQGMCGSGRPLPWWMKHHT
jgi:hypothetical protein